jgi:hypothetical protein
MGDFAGTIVTNNLYMRVKSKFALWRLIGVLIFCFSASPVTHSSTINKTRGPYLQRLTPQSVIVRWRTDVASQSKVCYGRNLISISTCLEDVSLKTEHRMEIFGLDANTRYFYMIGHESTALAGPDSSISFVTAPISGLSKNTRIWVLGDSGSANNDARAVRDGYLSYSGSRAADFCLMLGDNAYNTGTDAEYQAALFEPYAQILGQCPLWSAIGNHDGYSANSATQSGPYFDIFSFPRSAQAGGVASGTEAYYSFDYGQAHFVVLDSNGSNRNASDPMANWLRSDLQGTQAKWIIALWHHPPFTKGSHDSDSTVDSEGRMVEMRQNILPILEEFGVDLVLSGHSHSYERSYLVDGHYGLSSSFNLATHTVSSSSGQRNLGQAYRKPSRLKVPHSGTVYAVAGSSGWLGGGSLNHPAMYVSLNILGSMVIDIDGPQLEARFIDGSGSHSRSIYDY